MPAETAPYPRYPLPWKILPGLLKSFLAGERRSFHADSVRALGEAAFPLQVNGRENIPGGDPALLTVNHYSRPGFKAWWFVLAISALIPVDVHWVMTAEWTPDGSPGSYLRAWFSRCFFTPLAHMYGFTPTPPMPPRPYEVEARARAVRRVLAAARADPPPIFGMAPEGQDAPGGVLMNPHPGVGRFLLHLAKRGFPIYPVGAYEAEGALCLGFGAPYHLGVPAGLSSAEADRRAARIVMRAIACQLPPSLRGDFDI